MAFLADVQKEVCDGEVPALPLRWWGLFAGILNFFFFGWGELLSENARSEGHRAAVTGRGRLIEEA
jgi:hypothetical protein